MFRQWLKKHRIMRKGVTLAVLLAFFASFIATDAWSVAEIGEVSYTAEMEGPPPLQAETFTIPDYLATVRDYQKGTTNKMIIHIQDAHCNYDAQKRVSEIIDYLTNQYGITEINLEGGKGSYDLAPFTGIINSDIRETVSDYFVREGTVTGAEYFAINNPDKVTLWGVEETKLYMDNLSVYRGSLAYKEEAEGYLKNLSYLLNNLKMKIYSKELFDVDLKYSQYKANNLDFKDYLTFLLEKAKERGIVVKEYPNIYLLTQSLEQEKEINFKRANNQRDELVDSLQKILSKRSLEELVKNTVDFKAKRLSQYDYYEFLLERANLANIKLESYPDLQKYIVYISLYHAADKAAIMAELTTLEEDIKATLFQNDTQRNLSVLSKNLTLEKNMFAFSFTKEDWEYYSKNKASFGVRNFSSFIKREAPKYKITAQLDRNVGRLDGFRDKLEKFFSFSFKRDDAFLENLRFKGQKEGIEAAIIVTGGFHTENLCALFRKKGISYVSLMPNFTNKEGYASPYFALLGGKETKLESFLDKALSYRPEESTIAYRSLFSEMGVDIRAANMSTLMAQVLAHILKGTDEPFVLQTENGYVTISRWTGKPREGSDKDVFFTAQFEDVALVASVYDKKSIEATRDPRELEERLSIFDDLDARDNDGVLKNPVFAVDGDTMKPMQQELWIDMVGKAVGSERLGSDAIDALFSAFDEMRLTEDQKREIRRYIDAGKVHVWKKSIGPVDGHPGANEIYLNPELFTQGPQGYRKAAVVLLHELGAAFGRPDSENRLINKAYNRGDMSGVKEQAGLIIAHITVPGAAWRGRGEDVDYMATTGTQMFDAVGFVGFAYGSENPEEIILSKISELYDQGKMRDAGFLAGAMLEQIRALQESGELFGPKGAESGFAIFSEKIPIYVLAQMLNMYGNDRIEGLLTTYSAGKRALGERLKSPDVLPDYLRVRLLGDDEFESFRDLLGALGYQTRDQIRRISREWDEALDKLEWIETYNKEDLPSKMNALELKGLKRAWAREMREMHERGLADGDPKDDNILFPEKRLKNAVRSAVLKGANTRFNWRSLPLDRARPRHFDFDRFWELSEMPQADVAYDFFVKLVQQPARFSKFTETDDRAGDIENRKTDIKDTLRALWEEGIAHEIMGRTEAERDKVVDLVIEFYYTKDVVQAISGLEKLMYDRLNEEAKILRNVFIDAMQHVNKMNKRGQRVTSNDFLVYIETNAELMNRPGMERVGPADIRWIVEGYLNDDMIQRMINYEKVDEVTGKNDAEIENMFLVKLAKLSVFGLTGLRRSDFRAKHKGAGGIIERCTSDVRNAIDPDTGSISSFSQYFENEERIKRVYNVRKDEVELLRYWTRVGMMRRLAGPFAATEPVSKEVTPLLVMGVGMFNAGGMNGVHSEEKFLEDIDELKKRLAGKEKDPDAIKEVLVEFLKERYKELRVEEDHSEVAKKTAKDYLDSMSPDAIMNVAIVITDLFAGRELSATKELKKLTTKSKLTDVGTSITAKCVFKTQLLHRRNVEPVCTLDINPAANLDALRGRIYRRTFEGAVVPIDDVRAYLSGLAERQKGKYVVVRKLPERRSSSVGGVEVETITMEFPDGEILEVDPGYYLGFMEDYDRTLGMIFRKVDRYERIRGTLDSVKVVVNRFKEEHIVDTDIISAESPIPGMPDFLVIRQLRWDTPEWNRIEGMDRGERMRSGEELFDDVAKEAKDANSPASSIIQDITASAETNLEDIMNLKIRIASMRAKTLGVTPDGLKLYDAKSLVEMDGDVVWGLAVSIYRMINSSKDPLNFDIDAEITEDMIRDYFEMINRGQVILAFRNNSPVGVLTLKDPPFTATRDSSEVVDLGVSPDIADNDTLINIRNSLMDQAMETLLKAPGNPAKSVILIPRMSTHAFYSRYFDRVKTLSELSDFEQVRDDASGRNAIQLRPTGAGLNVTCGTMTRKEHDDVEKGLRTQLRNFYKSLGVVGRILSEREADSLLIATYGEKLGITQADLDSFRNVMREKGVPDDIPVFFTMPEGWERGEMLFRVGERAAAAHFAETAKRIQVSLPFLTNNPFRSPSEAAEIIAGHEAKHIAEPDFGSSEDHDDEAIDLVRRVAAATRIEPTREEELAEAARRRGVERSTHTVRSINSAENRNAGVIVVGKGPEGKKEKVDRLGPGLTRVGRATGRAGIGHLSQINHIMTYRETTAGAIASVVLDAVKVIAGVKEYKTRDVVANYSENVNVKELIDALVDELGPALSLSVEERKRMKDGLFTEGVAFVKDVRITLVRDSYTDFAYPDLMFRYALARDIAYYETARSEDNKEAMERARELVLSHLSGGCSAGFVSEMEKIADAGEFFSMLYTTGLKVEKIDFESIREYISSMIETSISL